MGEQLLTRFLVVLQPTDAGVAQSVTASSLLGQLVNAEPQLQNPPALDTQHAPPMFVSHVLVLPTDPAEQSQSDPYVMQVTVAHVQEE